MWYTHPRLKDRDQHSIAFRVAGGLSIVGYTCNSFEARYRAEKQFARTEVFLSVVDV